MAKFKKYKFIRLSVATIVFGLFTALFAGVGKLEFLAEWQIVPAILRIIAYAGAGAVVVLLILLLTAVIAGRWYCALLCPLGIYFDLVDLIPCPGKSSVKQNFIFLRLAVVVLCLSLLIEGISGDFMLFDPYSNFGRTVSGLLRGSFSVGMLVSLCVLTALAIWKRRFYCTSICPVGTLLNLLSRHSLFKLRIKENCVKCRQCEKKCPAGCIDIENTTIDNGRCVRCAVCLDECNFSAIGFTGKKIPVKSADISRRDFIKRGSVAIGSTVAGTVMLKLGIDKFAPDVAFSKILPPGAGTMARFSKKCTSCLICVQNCPQNIIRPAVGGDAPVSLDLHHNFCSWDCKMCSDICPTGALHELSLEEKQHTQIALAQISSSCVGCRKCVPVCHAKAISMKPNGCAAVEPQSCVGCGRCTFECPVKAISLMPVAIQKELQPRKQSEPQESKKSPKAVINFKSCFSCGSCAEVCPVKAITLSDDETPQIIDSRCIGCGKCVKICPAKAISLQ